MPISIQVDPETGVAIATCSGVLRVTEAEESAAALWKTPGWPGRAVVWDLRDAEFDMTSSDTREVARFILQHQPTPPPAKVGFVVRREVDFGMSRVFGVYREDAATDFEVFRDYDEALLWARATDSEAP